MCVHVSENYITLTIATTLQVFHFYACFFTYNWNIMITQFLCLELIPKCNTCCSRILSSHLLNYDRVPNW